MLSMQRGHQPYYRKIALVLLLGWMFFSLLPAQAEPQTPARPKIGLALSGGGALGIAHIGTLKLLDSLAIPIDYIAGTSMGGIAAALYAIGYSGEEMERIAYTVDWDEIFDDLPPRRELPFIQKQDLDRYQFEIGIQEYAPTGKKGLISGQNIYLLFSELAYPYENIGDFDRLPIPFRCTAVDLITGNLVILGEGSLAQAMRATMSIPSVFAPVQWGDSLLVDGGLLNNLPVDIVREMGADIVIAVGVENTPSGPKEIRHSLDVLNESYSIVRSAQLRSNIENADIFIDTDLEGFTIADFELPRIQGIVDVGERAAYQKLDEIVALKERYDLQRSYTSPIDLRSAETEDRIIYAVNVTGNTTLPFRFVNDMLDLQPGAPFQPDSLLAHIMKMKASGYFECVDYEVQPYGDSFVKLNIRVKECRKPVIYGVNIRGNRVLPFDFIYRLLDIKPGDLFDTEMLDERITSLYSLGYFESIHYNVTPVSENQVRLTIQIQETATTRLRVGVRYDNHYRFLAALNLQTLNFLLPGLRIEGELQAIGLTRAALRAYYPSRSLDMPIYPFVRAEYRKIPVSIFDFDGSQIASYNDEGIRLAAGLGILDEKNWNLDLYYRYENLDVRPEIALPDTSLFPIWKERLQLFCVDYNLDVLDDTYDPTRGARVNLRYENSTSRLNSAVDFRRLEAWGEVYTSPVRQHVLHFAVFHGRGEGDLPIYRNFYLGGPERFIGLEYDQLNVNHITILRVGYQYALRRNLRISLMLNRALDYQFEMNGERYGSKQMWGYGIGLRYLTPLGPLELAYGIGEKRIFDHGDQRGIFYLSAGYRF